jgi:hypothetical protein
VRFAVEADLDTTVPCDGSIRAKTGSILFDGKCL